MSKFLRFLFLSVALLSGLTMGGQSLTKQIQLAERAREKYGETDERYLDALTSVVNAAVKENNFPNAEEWQSRYLEIIEKIDGDTSERYLTGRSYYMDILLWSFEYYGIFDIYPHDSELFVGYKWAQKNLISTLQHRYEENSPLVVDDLYINSLKRIIKFCRYVDDYQGVFDYAPTLLTVYEKSLMGVSLDYLQSLYDLIWACHNLGNFFGEHSMHKQYEELSDALGVKSTEPYLNYLRLITESLSSLYSEALANHYSEELINRFRNEYEVAAQDMIDLSSSLYGDYSVETLSLTGKIAGQYESMGLKEKALLREWEVFEIMDSLHVFEAINSPLAEKNVFMLREAGGQCLQRGDINAAFNYYDKARKFMEKGGAYNSEDYIHILYGLAWCYWNFGKRSIAIALLDKALPLAEAQYGRQSLIYGGLEIQRLCFFAYVHDYPSCIDCCKNVVDVLGEEYGRDSEPYAIWLSTLGDLYRIVGDFSTAEELLLQSLDILEPVDSYQSVYILHCLAGIYDKENDTDTAVAMMEKAERLIQNSGLEDKEEYFYIDAGLKAMSMGSPEGEKYLNKALQILEKASDKQDFSNIYYRAYIYLILDSSKTVDFIPPLVEAYKAKYLDDAVFLNSAERESLMSGESSSHTKDIMFSSREEGKYDTELYDFLLFNKGLLLGTSIGYAKAVYDSGEEELVRKYETLQNLRRYINGEPVVLDGDYTTEKAKTEATALEREITLYLRQNGGYTGGLDCSYEDVRNALGDDEIAVEFVEYKDYTDNTEYYAALLAKSEWSKPKYVRLCKKDDLDKMVGQSPDKLYGETFVSQTAYDLIWTPLEPYLDSVRTVYFSPAGHINRMAVGHLYNGEKYFCETYNVVRVTSTREICNKYLPKDYSSAVLYGGLTYDEDDETLIAESRSVTGDVSGFRERFRGFTDGATRKGWNYLPGTLEEVNRISSVLADATINYDLYSSEKGNEESFKALSGTEFNILHIATHGFYMTESRERSDFFSSYAMSRLSFGSFGTPSIDAQPLTMSFTPSPFSAGISPLQRSGLILSGSNRVWTGQSIPDGVEDGILTAAEVANLDFSYCDIVVLSACETGLGEITDEGVFGLQRAFKNAGVNTIVMSLWNVDDTATALMMQTFYRNLVSGMSKREAFLNAKNVVREKHPVPRDWAAFIMLD